jgi:CubicO group peptidase (beta-lactamase class C family)
MRSEQSEKSVDAEAVALPRESPSRCGVSSRRVIDFLRAVDATGIELHSLMVARGGRVAAEGWWAPYRADLPHQLHSLVKMVFTTAVGIAVDEGFLSLDDRIVDWFADDLPPEPGTGVEGLRVIHLLTGSTGHEAADVVDESGLIWTPTRFLQAPIRHEPGTTFLYNPQAFHLLVELTRRAIGQGVPEYLNARLFGPLGIAPPPWNPADFPDGLRTEDLVKIGQLYLNGGVWNGRRILSPEWVAAAVRQFIPAPQPSPYSSYGYFFWQWEHGYQQSGAFGQYCVVDVDADAVVAVTAETRGSDPVSPWDLIVEHLIPATRDPVTPDEDARLAAALGGLELSPPAGAADSPLLDRIGGRPLVFEQNELGWKTVRFDRVPGGIHVTLDDAEGTTRIACAYGAWLDGVSTVNGTPPGLAYTGDLRPARVAAAAAWIAPNVLRAVWRYVELPHHDTITCTWEAGVVVVEIVHSQAGSNGLPERRPILRASTFSELRSAGPASNSGSAAL